MANQNKLTASEVVMKRMSRIICTLAALLMSLGAVQTANALQLKQFSPNFLPVGGGGHPTWVQDVNSIAIQPPVAPVVGFPVTIPATGFPVGFPAEFFYYHCQSDTVHIGNSDVDVFFALEGSWVDALGTLIPGTPAQVINPVLLPLKPIVFQRLRMRVRPTGPLVPGAAINQFAAGDWTIVHPWGTTTFNCPPGSGNNASCQVGNDIGSFIGGDFISPLGSPVANAGIFTGINIFAKSTAAIPPSLGDFATLAPIISAGTTPLPNGNIITIIPPAVPGAGVSTDITNFLVAGRTIGIDVQPGTTIDAGQVIMPATSAPKTITVTNTTANPITFPALATLTGADPLEFAVVAPAAPTAVNCLTATVPPTTVPGTGTCSFDITFTPSTTNLVSPALRNATIALAPVNTPVVVGASIPPPVTVNLTGTAQVLITLAAATPNGTIIPDATVNLVTGGAPANSPVIFTVTPNNKKFKVKSVDDGGALLGTPVVGTPPFTLNTGVANHTVTANFMQSGDLDADGFINVNDAMKALRIVAGVQVADIDDPTNTAVKVAPLDAAGLPAALDAKTTPDIGDVLVILRRALNLGVAW
jgi:hypothetical protein